MSGHWVGGLCCTGAGEVRVRQWFAALGGLVGGGICVGFRHSGLCVVLG